MDVPAPFRVVLLGPVQQRLDHLGSLLARSGYRVAAAHLSPGDQLLRYDADAIVVDTLGLTMSPLEQDMPPDRPPLLLVGAVGDALPDEQQLVLRVAVVCRRGRLVRAGLTTLGVEVSRDSRSFSTGPGVEAVLTPMEFQLLCGIVAGAGEVVPRDLLLRLACRGRPRISHATLDSHIRRVRAKLDGAGVPLRISTRRGFGYSWVLPAGPA